MRIFQKKNTSRRIFLQFAFVFGIASVLFCVTNKIHAQDDLTPKRGFHPAGSYAPGDIETISTTGGNLMLHIPLASLPAGRAGLSHGVGLHYNSKLYDQYTSVGTDPFLTENNLVDQNRLSFSNEGGWMYTTFYSLQIIDRATQYPSQGMPQCPDPGANYRYKLKMRFPDGSLHEFRPLDGFNYQWQDWFRFSAAGHWEDCNGPAWTATTLRYYSVDSTYMRLDVQNNSGQVVSWTLYLPDGGRVTGGNQPNRIYDRNNNYIEFQYVDDYNQTGHPAELIVDQMGRSLVIEHNYAANEDYVREQGFDGQTLTWTVKWNNMWVLKKYAAGGGSPYPNYDGPPWTEDVFSFLYVVERITLPAQTGGLSYTFTYNSNATWPNISAGWGELSSVTLPEGVRPSGATASYQYSWDGVGNTPGEYLSSQDVLNNAPVRKDLTYWLEYDGGANQKTETWLYNFNTQGGSCSITKPDGGVVREDFTAPGHFWAAGLVHKTTEADGSMTERLWKQNVPFGMTPPLPSSGFHTGVNTYLKTEFRTEPDSAGNPVKTAIKDFTYDKNGNLTQVAEYDWVAYSSIPRDIAGKPTGVPGGLTPKRVTVNTYYNATPDASNTTIDDPDVYHKLSSPNLKRAIESSETRSDFGSVLSRAESFYDNPSTTGNLTLERKWDSTKGGISSPLGAGNSISVTHQYDPYGNRTHTTDANNVTTWFVYGSINGHGNLYVTETKVAVDTAVQQWTMRTYDFHTGLVTQSTDVDNNVTNKTTYDVFGRPLLVEEADGIAGVEKQTATEYSDAQRRVIVRSDLNTTGDGKLITIQHYDQLGRIRLTRRLESGNPADATDETKGVKVQTRYFAGDAGNQNSYELVSAFYRAATSGAAGGEPGMAWKRSKFDKGGKVIEVETFIGATPPAPWGGNSVSSGKFITDYDAEFTTVTDQAGKKRRSRMDALGRLVRVDEPDAVGNLGATAAPVQPTDYIYNALDNLIQTSQTGVPNGGSSPVTQIRTFTFSSLGRLISANNPESGLITHEYDANGNLKKKTDARGVFINYTYDQLNRNRTVDYSNTAVNPDITRVYDNPTLGAYGRGKFWHDYAGGDYTNGQNVEHKAVDSYDALGRPLSVRRHFKNNGVWSNAFTTSQTYDLAGHVKTKTYPSGRSGAYTYDIAGDLISFTGNLGDGAPRTYSTGIQYNPQGQLIREQFGTSTPLYHRRHYNSRGQLFDVRLGTDGNALNDGPNPAQWTGASWNRGALRMFFSSNVIEYSWPAAAPQHNNGNIYRQDHFVPTAVDGGGNVTSWVLSADYYGYDTLNRVTLAAEETYTSAGGYTPNVFNQQFSYDRFGNRLVSSAVGTGVPNPGFKINGANNRLIAPADFDGGQASDRMRYDASGNLIKDTHTQTGTTGNRIYDAENRMTSADGANGLANNYAYDADGHRTRRSLNSGGEVWWQVFGISGELVAEYQLVGGTPTLKKEYGYRNGQLLVIAETTGTCQWLVTDALGTPRMIADQTGGLSGVKRRDYLPFGEEILAGIGHRQATNGYSLSQSQQPRQQFTGKERDPETNLDYFEARYYGSVYGRFTSPDEFTGGPDELYDFADNAGDNPLMYAEKGEPQSLNKYQYCYNNPLVFTDIDGHKPWDWVKAGLEVASWVPGPIGTVASVAQAGIALAEGDYKGAALAAAGAIPGGKLIGGAVKATAKVLDKIGDAAKVVDKLRDVASAAKRAGAACGLCFTAGTEVSTPDGLVKIEELRVGDKVTTTNIAKDKPDGWTAVDPKRWRVVKLLMPDPKGSEDVYEIELLRSLKWIRDVGAAPRRWIEITLPEMGLTGLAKVAAITACPKIKAGSGRVVLTTVTHMDQGLMEIEFAGLKKALEPTVSHPLFSEDRNDWIAAGYLRIGERIRTKTRTARIEAIRWKRGERRVYNIEVEADHSYYVSTLELLSHNNSPCAKAFEVAKHGKQPTPRGNLQSHHIIQDAWAKNNVTGYNSGKAPSILLPQKNHSIVTTAQNARRDARLDAGQGRWSSTLRGEFDNASRDLRNAGVPDAARKKAIKQAYKYFDELQ